MSDKKPQSKFRGPARDLEGGVDEAMRENKLRNVVKTKPVLEKPTLGDHQSGVGPTDAAALAGSAVATTISLAVSNGPYGFLSLVTSISLLLIIFGYVWPHKRTTLQSCAAAGAIAIAAVPGIGAGLEYAFGLLGRLPNDDHSRVSDAEVGIAWLVSMSVVAYWDTRLQAKRN